MTIKPFAIQGADLTLGGVSLQAGTTGVVIPGVTQAVNYFVEEVDEQDGNNPNTFGGNENAVTVIDNAEYLYRSGIETPSNLFSAAGYSVDELDDGEIEEINVELVGTFLDSDKLLALRDNMWATTVADPFVSFDADDWTQIPFKPKLRAGEVENVGGSGGSITVGNGVGASVSNVTEILINGTITEIEPGLVGITVSGSEGLPTITIPVVLAGTYKGLQASYGVVHSNSSSNELNVNKIIIHKPVDATVTIDADGGVNDDFEVSGLGTSDVLAMFITYGDVNGAKSLSDLQAFAEAAIDLVILDGGVESAYNTVDAMKTAFYANYSTLATAANGLYTAFEFYQNNLPTLNGGLTTVQEGSGATFDIIDNGNGSYSAGIVSGGTNYLAGHKIKILGSLIGGVDGTNDIVITVAAVGGGGGITGVGNSGTAAGTVTATYTELTGTNYNVGSGFTLSGVYAYNTNADVSAWGSNYVVGDLITLLGADITGGTTPANNFTFTVTEIGGNGEPYGYVRSGTAPEVWRNNSIDDGGRDQYDTGNYINTNLAQEIAYNNGETVEDGEAAFGADSAYTFVYDTAIFGLFVRGSSATSLSTSGGSGADGNSTTETGSVFGDAVPEQTFTNAVSHINFVNSENIYAGALVSFTHTDNGDEVDILIADDGDGAGVGITRDSGQGIYNPYRDDGWSSSVSPSGTLWNTDGWANFSDVTSRTYDNLYAAFGSGGLGNKIVGTECVMYLPDNGKYYAVKFSSWTQNGNGGGFAYTRQELDLANVQQGIRFSDGTRLNSAEGVGRVKLTSPGSRRIEEVHGYKQVAVTSRTISNTITTTVSAANAGNTYLVRIDATGSARDALIALANGSVYYRVQVSVNQTDWITGLVDGWGTDDVQIYFDNGLILSVDENDTIYYRTLVGGESVVWWDKDDLPAGGSNFRGAVIDYHAYTDDGTIIGTIHIVDDDGEEHITHTEVASGNSDLVHVDLWHVTSEGEIRYRQLDGDSSTLKIQWTAKVFYGSELYD